MPARCSSAVRTLAEIVIESYYPADEGTAAYFTEPDGAAAS
jgi:hypothetical protein